MDVHTMAYIGGFKVGSMSQYNLIVCAFCHQGQIVRSAQTPR